MGSSKMSEHGADARKSYHMSVFGSNGWRRPGPGPLAPGHALNGDP